MDLRTFAKFDRRYSEVNREERNYAALFYHFLLQGKNLQKFLDSTGSKFPLTSDYGIYFEYSFLRDIWYTIQSDAIKLDFIRLHLPFSNMEKLCSGSRVDFNRYFGVMGEASTDSIQFPGNWSISKYDETIKDNDEFLKTCIFKWSFNIKPDIVIHTDKNHAICIEAKYESGEGAYPSSSADKAVFKRRGLAPVSQTKLQEYMLTNLLGVQTEFLFLVNKRNSKSETHKTITWQDAFGYLDLSDCPTFAKDTLANVGAKVGT